MSAALAANDSVSVIAEVKRRSPSRGDIAAGLDAPARAAAYARSGATAISVLVEPRHFGGSVADLVAVRAAVRLPVLQKDFVVDDVQLLEARAIGASAVLLIARALAPVRLASLAAMATELGLQTVVEVRTRAELERAIALGASMIGVNSRDLETLIVDDRTVPALLPHVPSGVIAIAESGMHTREDVARAAASGADAVLVGSVLSQAEDPEAALRDLVGVPRSRRAS